MEENEPVGEGIFTNLDEQTQSLRENAEALGINPDLIAPDGEPQARFYAKKGCKHCFGKGVLNIVLSPSKRRVFWRNERQPTKVSFRQTKAARSRRIGPTKPATKKIYNVSEANESEWDTRRPEPLTFKRDNMAQAFCRCIRVMAG